MIVDLILKGDEEAKYLKRVDLSRTPVVGEKINVVMEDDISSVYLVVDVLFYENQKTDIFVTLDGTVTACFARCRPLY